MKPFYGVGGVKMSADEKFKKAKFGPKCKG